MKALKLKTHTKLPYQRSMLRRTEWWVQNETITKNWVLPVTTLFPWKLCFSLRNSYKELIWCTKNPNIHIHTFCKRWVLSDGAFYLWISLITLHKFHTFSFMLPLEGLFREDYNYDLLNLMVAASSDMNKFDHRTTLSWESDQNQLPPANYTQEITHIQPLTTHNHNNTTKCS